MARRDVEQRVLRTVRDVLHEQQDEDVVLVLRCVHAAAELVAALPQCAVELGLLDRHRYSDPSLTPSSDQMKSIPGACNITSKYAPRV